MYNKNNIEILKNIKTNNFYYHIYIYTMIKLIKYIIFIFIGIILYYIQKQYIETLSIGGLTVYYRKNELLPDMDRLPDFLRLNLNEEELNIVYTRLLSQPYLKVNDIVEDIIVSRFLDPESGIEERRAFAPSIVDRIVPEIPEITSDTMQTLVPDRSFHSILKRYTFRIGSGDNNDDYPSRISCVSIPDPEPEPEPESEPQTELIELPLGYRRCKTYDVEDDIVLDPYDPTTGEFLKADIFLHDQKWLYIRRIYLDHDTINFECSKNI